MRFWRVQRNRSARFRGRLFGRVFRSVRDGREGVLQIMLRRIGANRAELTVEDNGVGSPGYRLFSTLLNQLRAAFSLKTGDAGSMFRFNWEAPETDTSLTPALDSITTLEPALAYGFREAT